MKKLLVLIAAVAALCSSAAAQEAAAVRKIDFTNFTFRVGDKTVKMKDGLQDVACREKDENGVPSGDIWSNSKESVGYGDIDGDGREEAFVPLIANVCGGNMVTDEALLVFTMKGGKPVPLPVFDYTDEACPTGEKCDVMRSPGVSVSYDAREKALVVENSFATDDDAICCPSLYRLTWYRWNGSAFVELKKGKITKREENK